jgi:tetratricopeptide (TPR) repeat protein
MAQVRAQVLARNSRADALAYLKGFITRNPDARDARLTYARLLVGANQIGEAKSEFARLASDFPKNAEVSLTAGLLALQTGDPASAQALLTQTLDYAPKDVNAVYYYLGLTAEELKQPERALEWHAKVGPGSYAIQARARQASLLARAGKLDEARALIAATVGHSDEERIRLAQAEAELLRDAKDHVAVYKVLTEALARYPDSVDLLYDRAMSAEKIGRLDVLEADLRRLIELQPDYAQAYNALGYTLADRTDRLAEAVALLDKALALAPDDAFILDSAGWVQYRLGNLARAQEYIERAYKARPDPEIAAHLGEVMWARGQQSEATTLWQSVLQAHPQNELLLETLKRFPR